VTTDASIHEELDGLLQPCGDATTRPMFGGQGYFVGDWLFGAFYGGIATKLPEWDREEVINRRLASPFTLVPKRRFGNSVRFPLEGTEGVEALLFCLKKAYAYVLAALQKGRTR
jgi:hypothetical protein